MTTTLQNKRVLLIISGGLAAYKSLDLIRRLRERGVIVRCVLTAGGAKFVTPLSVSALSEQPVYTDLWSLTDERDMGHIRLSRESDLIIVAPCSANMIAKMAHGLADDLASTVLLAADKPVMIVPAMNGQMWSHAATQANVATLLQRGVRQIGPAAGLMACGEVGEGRMADIPDILTAVEQFFAPRVLLSGVRALVTSGPTFEPLDPVRFIGNRSSGKQGHAIARALQARGVDTVLVTGPTHQADPAGVQTIHVETARDMLEACQNALPADIAVCAAAVSDWRPETMFEHKLKKGMAEPVVTMTENPDILATLSVAGNRRPRLVVGFAAETENLLQNAAQKIERKQCDWLIANLVGPGQGFDRDTNQVTLIRRDGTQPDAWPEMTKDQIAEKIVDQITKVFAA